MRHIILSLSFTVGALSCGSGDPSQPAVDASPVDASRPPPQCIPGAQVSCACLGGAGGVQVCDRDGFYSACACASVPTTDVPSGEPLPMQPRVNAPYDRCAPRESTCANGTMCLRALVGAADAGSLGHTCTMTCTSTRDCAGYIDGSDRQSVECLMLGGLRQCVRNCSTQSDCATSLTSCVFVTARKFSACAP